VSSRHKSSVAKAGAPVSPQSSPPRPLALLRVRGLLLLLGSEKVDLTLWRVGIGEASWLEFVVGMLEIFGNAPDVGIEKKVSRSSGIGSLNMQDRHGR
jgi:hypothetical protein